MVGGGCHDVAPGEATDATGMMLCLAESLADHGGHDPADVMARYRDWFLGHPRDVSLTVRAALLAASNGTPWDLASRRAYEILGYPTAGNGSIMRCAPLALLYLGDADERRRSTLRESDLTHFDHLAGWACVAFNELLAAAMAGRLAEQVPAIAAALDDEDARVAAAVRDAVAMDSAEITVAAFVLDSLRAALWAVLHRPTFEDAVIEIVNRGNDCDTVGAMTGALAGALHGEEAIPRRWLDVLEPRERTATAADRLADLAGA
jgi:ADP-ribosyl-[dinitrogen reductase] hydrolase